MTSSLSFSRRAMLATMLATGVSFQFSHGAAAQNYPDRPIRIIVPFAAGGGSDVVGRVIAQKLTEKLGQSVVVENRTGAGGSFGAAQVARATPDGYTLLLGSSSEITQYPNVAANVPYNAQRDFAPIALLATVPLVLVATKGLPVSNVQELLDYARKNPGKLNYGSAGPGSSTHLAMALLTSTTGLQMTHVPYRGSAPVVTDLLAGNLQLATPTISAVLPYAAGGELRILAVTTAKRAVALPQTPTVSEGGVQGYAAGLWTGLLAPANTPDAIVKRLNTVLAEIANSPELKEALAKQGAEPASGTPEQFAELIARDLATWQDVAKKTGIRIE